MAIITISRGSMSGGEALAACLKAQLKYPMLGREVLVSAAEKLGVGADTLARKITASPTLWERMTSDRRLYVVAVQAALAERAVGGDMIYHGHAGHLLLKGMPSVIRVRLIAPLELRVKAVIERQHLNQEAAADYIRHVDEERIRWTKLLYGVDWQDPALYDIVVNLEKMSIETAAAMIAAMVGKPEFAVTEAAKNTLADFLTACRVKLALATNPQTRDLPFEAVCRGGAVEITGELADAGILTHASARDEEQVQRTAQAVAGVKTVRLNLRKFDAYH